LETKIKCATKNNTNKRSTRKDSNIDSFGWEIPIIIMNISIDILMLKPQAALVKRVSMLQEENK